LASWILQKPNLASRKRQPEQKAGKRAKLDVRKWLICFMRLPEILDYRREGELFYGARTMPCENYSIFLAVCQGFLCYLSIVVVLEEISKLTYLLGKGSISTEQSYVLYNKYRELFVQTRTMLGG
jgi:hypothetical protein